MTNIAKLIEKGDVCGLVGALQERGWKVRRHAATALGEIDDLRAVEPLIAALGDGDGDVRSSVAVALGKIGDPRTVIALEKATNDSDYAVRDKAKEALGAIKVSDAYKDYLKEQALAKSYKESSALVSFVESEILELKSSGMKAREAEVLLERAKTRLNENDFEQAKELANRANRAMNKVKRSRRGENRVKKLTNREDDRKAEYDIAFKSISEAERILNKTKAGSFVVSDELLTKSKQAYTNGDFKRAERLAEKQKSLTLLLKEAYEEASTFILPIELETTKLKSSGVEVHEAEMLLKQAKTRLNENDFEQAKELANRAKKVANERKAKYDLAVKQISETEEIVSRVGAEGVVISDDLLTESKRAFGGGDYEIAIKSVEEQKKLVINREIRHKEAMQHIKSAEPAIEKVEELGCEISSALGLLKEANSAFDIGNYEEAIKHAKQGQDTVKRIQEESKPEITIKFPEETFKPNTWKRIEITITNTGSIHAKNIKIKPSSDIEFRRIPTIPQIDANETKTMTIGMKPTVMGDVPIDVKITFTDALDREYTASEEMWLPVAESMPMSESISINEFSTRQGQSEYKYQVALSFAGEDRKYAKGLAGLLKNKNISFFYDKYEQADLWGKDLYQHLQSVYRDKAQYCVVFLSHAYAQKLWTRHELESAQARAFREHKEYILPVKIDDIEIPGINETIGYIDLKSTSLEEIVDMLVKKLSSQNLEE
jgi:hypothetical protein